MTFLPSSGLSRNQLGVNTPTSKNTSASHRNPQGVKQPVEAPSASEVKMLQAWVNDGSITPPKNAGRQLNLMG
jgi:hypothetical protein